MIDPPAANEIEIVRLYAAPVAAVWDAWVDPEQVGQWWGPRGFTLTTRHKDVRVGGTWAYTMHGPDGKDWPNLTTFLEVEERARLVYDHGATETTAPMFRVTARFKESEGGTELRMRMALPTAEAAEKTRQFVKAAGGDATWDRLGEFLEERLHGKECFLIHRSFDAPAAKLYAMWTTPSGLAQWLPPTGFEMQFLRADIAPGATSFFSMSNGEVTMRARAEYLELEAPKRVVYTQQFCDEHERPSRHPMAPTWPETMLVTISFTKESETRTRVAVVTEPYGYATREEIAAFTAARAGMTAGWTGSFDKLEAALGAAS